VCVCVCVCVCADREIHIENERERERERDVRVESIASKINVVYHQYPGISVLLLFIQVSIT
jgi:hypothetical protein